MGIIGRIRGSWPGRLLRSALTNTNDSWKANMIIESGHKGLVFEVLRSMGGGRRWALVGYCGLGIVLLIVLTGCDKHKFTTSSMAPTIAPGETIEVNYLAYKKRSPQRWDVVL